MALQAVYDAGHFDGDEDGYVRLQEATERIARYVDRVSAEAPDTPSKIEGLIGQFPERLLERERRNRGLFVRCTDEGKARFLSPVDEGDQEDGEINENTGGFEHAELMRAAYDDLLAVGLPLHVVRQDGDDDPDAIAEPESTELRAARKNSTLEPTEVASLVETFREENELLDRLTDAGTVDIEAEHTTGDSAPGVTLEHIARSIENGRRIILLAWSDTAESIARRLDEYPECMRTFSGEDGVHRLYNANGDVRAGPNEIRVYRPAGGQNKWLYHEATGEVELRANGETIATFADPEGVFADPMAYPATEKDISDFSE